MAIICHYSSLCNEYIPSEALSGFSPFQLVFLQDPPDLTSLSFLKIDTIPVNYCEYYNLILARAQMIGRLLLEWRTKQALEYEKKNRQYTNEMFQDDQMIYLLAPHLPALQIDTTKFKQDFIGPLFIDTAIDKTHYRLKDATSLLLDGTYHMNRITKGSACTPQAIVDTFDSYQKALKNTLLNKLAIETPDNKIQEVTLKDGSKNLIIFLVLSWIIPPLIAKRSVMPKFQKTSKISYREEVNKVDSPHSCTSPGCILYATSRDGVIDMKRQKRDTEKEDITGFILKLIARPEYGTVYQHQGMLLQNLHCRYLYIVIRLPHLKDLDQKIPSFPNCNNYRICRASNPNPLNDDTKTNDNELHQQLCVTFKIDYLQEMDIITKVKARLECKINVTLLALLPNKVVQDSSGPVTSSDKAEHEEHSTWSKRAIPLLAITQGTAIGGMLIKGINALLDAKRANSFNNAIKMLNANVEITHNRLVTLENRTSMMVKAIMPVLKDLKFQINKTNERLASQYRMMSSAHNRYSLLFSQSHETQTIYHFALLLFKKYLTIQVGSLQRIHCQYIDTNLH